MITVETLLVETRKLIGTKFAHQGRGDLGVDCVGAGLVAVERAGLDLKELTGVDLTTVAYAREPSPRMLETVEKAFEHIPSPIPGCGLLMQMPGAQWPHHWGIYTDKGTFIHAEAVRVQRVVEQTFGRPWTRFLHSCWKIPGVSYP